MSAIPTAQLATRIDVEFTHYDWFGDPGFRMIDALKVDRDGSFTAWREASAAFTQDTDREAGRLRELAIDAVISNIGHVPVAAARAIDVPAIGICSLNWADVYASFYSEDQTWAQLQTAYKLLDLFIRPTPAMALPWLSPTVEVSPIATRGANVRGAIEAATGFDSSRPIGLISGGGHEFEIQPARWPEQTWQWLIPGNTPVSNGCVGVRQLDVDFIDLVESVDLVVAKPGYGLFAEATCAGVPMLYVDRSEWPEQPAILDWRKRYGQIEEVSVNTLQQGQLGAAADRVLDMPGFTPPDPNGADEAAQLILRTLRLRS